MKELGITLLVLTVGGMATCAMQGPTDGPLYGAVIIFGLAAVFSMISVVLSLLIDGDL